MPRRSKVLKRNKVLPDPVHGSVLLQSFINKMMYQGKKSTAETVVYGALEIVAQKSKLSPIEAFEKALSNVRPLMEVKPRRVGGATYQIPIEVPESRSQALAIQWIRESARKRSGHSMQEKLSSEILDALNSTGTAMKKREDTHKMAEANKAFAHFRW